ncbi:MAG: hypothetical protein ACREM3_26635 [Candidatus Rokuibacteriota bacterium]
MAPEPRPVILAVDDEPGILESLQPILRSDYEVLIALDARSALATLAHRWVHLLLLDLVLGAPPRGRRRRRSSPQPTSLISYVPPHTRQPGTPETRRQPSAALPPPQALATPR